MVDDLMAALLDEVESKHAIDSTIALEFHKSSISCLQECQSRNANKLCIISIYYKLENSDEYDIGGTYTDSTSDIWFYATTTVCPGQNFLLNIFACFRKVGFISIGISDSNMLHNEKKETDYVFLSENLSWKTFNAGKKDESFHIKTYYFNETAFQLLKDKIMCVPIKIEMDTFKLDRAVLQSIKSKHKVVNLAKEIPDFTLESASRKKFPTHKIILSMNSPVLKDMIRSSSDNALFLDISDEHMRLLIEFLYSGTIKEVNSVKLLDIAEKFQIKKLVTFVAFSIKQQININNALDIALIAQKYDLRDVEEKVFQFVKLNPQVLQSESWKNLSDIVLAKKLIEYIYYTN